MLTTAMNRHALAEDIAIADSHAPQAAGVCDILRFIADNRGGMDYIVGADLGAA
jgi:hypothetical protein